MTAIYQSLIRHTAIYGVGQVLARMTSVLLLPVYTRYLSPFDYGVIAVLDLVSAVLAIVLGGGMAAGAQRYHFETDAPEERARIWSTAILFVAIPPLPILLVSWWFRAGIAAATHGDADPSVADLYSLVLPTVWFLVLNQTADAFLRTRKQSKASVIFDLAGLALNIALNLYLLIGLGMGVRGVLLGNLLATGATAIARTTLLFAQLPWTRPSFRTLGLLARFGLPLVVSAVLATGMHQLDRYLLRVFRDLEEVGIYALAHTISQGAASLLLIPFSAAWEAIRYEIAPRSDAPQVFASVFRAFTYAIGVLTLGMALFSQEIVSVIAVPSFARAATFVPLLSLAYLMFSLHQHFSVPAYVHKVPEWTMAAFVAGFAATVGANLYLVPGLGGYGAALAKLMAFTVFSFAGLFFYARIERYPYPIVSLVAKGVALGLAFALVQSACASLETAGAIAIKLSLWLAVALAALMATRHEVAAERALAPVLSPLDAESE